MHLSAQNISNPYASIGKKAPKIATVTDGEYEEFFRKDSLVQIGTTVLNRYTGEVAFFEEDNLEKFMQFTKHNEKNFRFLSVDPLSDKYPHYTPYQFAANTPIQAIDIDGLEEFRVYRVFNPMTGQVTGKTRFVPQLQRQIVNGQRRGGVDYHITNSGTGNEVIIQMPDFIRGSKEGARARTQRYFYYPTAGDAVAGSNRQTGLLGNASGQVEAQDKHIVQGSPVKVLAGQLDYYPQPNLQEFYTPNGSAVTTQQFNAAAIADYLIANPTFTATIDANTDRVGSDQANLTLSQNRATNVMQAIVNAATNSGNYSVNQIQDLQGRITPVGHGESKAAANGAADNISNAADRTSTITVQEN